MMNRCALASIAAAVFATAITAAAASAAPVRTSQSGWKWGNPQPQGNKLAVVDFAGGRGYAAGEFGTLLRTDDGGSSWSGVRTALTDDFSKLRVIDADTFVAGGGCTLVRSDDGGQTLRRLRFNPSAACGSPLAAMHFVGKDVGYLVRSDNTVLRTEDGGSRFASRTPLPGTGGGPPNDAWFTSADTGVVVTGTDTFGRIWRTTDGGNSWNDAATSGAVRGVQFVSATVGYAAGQSVLKTTDGGATWQPTADQPDQGLRSVRCADEQHCVVVSTTGSVNYTDDGFASIKPSGIEPPPGGASILLPIAAEAASFASATRVATVGERGQGRTSDNAGRGFTPTDTALTNAFSRLRITSPSTLFAPGSAGSVARSTDAGATWSRVGAPTTSDIVDVAFPTANLGYAVDGEGALFRTDNGGTSWAILGEVGTRPRAVTASGDGNVVMLIGPRGILRSANAGANFDPVEAAAVGPKVELEDVDRTADNGIYVHGRRALAFSSDNGAKWVALKRPSTRPIAEIDFVDRKTGYVLTDDGRLWFTANRGASWRELLTLGRAGSYELAFGSKNDGYLAVDQFGGRRAGWVLHTSDGGASWRPQLVSSVPVQSGLGSLAAAGEGIAHALVGLSDMLQTDTGGDAAAPSTLTLTTKIKRLLRKGTVRVDGKLSPATPGAQVEVGVRELTSGKWRRQIVAARSDGTFSTTWSVKRSSSFVAQWAGSQALNGDGSPALRVTVGRR